MSRKSTAEAPPEARPEGSEAAREATSPAGRGANGSASEGGRPGADADDRADAAQDRPGAAEDRAADARALRAEVADLKPRLARALADYDNLQKRVMREAAAERDRARARALEGLLPVLELAQMAAHQAQAHPGPVSEGVILLAREFRRALERDGLVPFGAPGEAFDRTKHEAVAEEDVAGIAPGCVSRVIQTGYMLDTKVLRYAKVAVMPQRKQGQTAKPATDADREEAGKDGGALS